MTKIAQDADAPFDVAIIGGGASGVLAAIHLLHAAQAPLRIAIVEARSKRAQGVAYSTQRPEHLLNVIASRMSALDDDPGHFVRFLSDAPGDSGSNAHAIDINRRFARRMDFGRYLYATLQAAPGASDVHWIRAEAIDLTSGDGYTVSLRSGDTVRARTVVLAVGNEARSIPLPVEAIRGEPLIVSAWDYAAVGGIERDADVCIIGSGLSMVDAVMTMAERGHRGRMTVLSRHGLMPLPHASPGDQESDVDDLLKLGTRARLRALRQRAYEAERNGAPWQWTMDALRDSGQAFWKHSSAVERRRFLRHAARFWDIHRHRIAPEIAVRLEQLRAAGQLMVLGGRLQSITGEGSASRVCFRPRGAALDAEIQVSRVINATGIEIAIARTAHPLLKALHGRGDVRSGPQGLGIAANDNGAVIDRRGIAHPDLLVIGALRIGELWESIAVPELRVQAAQIAAQIVARQRIPEPN